MKIHTAMVTGADHGLGLALVKELLEEDVTVFAGQFCQEEGGLDSLAGQYGERLKIVSLDIGSTDSVRAAAAVIASQTERLDLLINNAGILGDIDSTIYDELDYDEMLRVFNVNSLGPLRMIQFLLPLLLQSEAKFIANISSEAGSIGQNWRSSWFAYTMSKAALNMESNVVHAALKESGAQVLLIHPGWMQTYMRGSLDIQAELTPEESAAKIIQLILERVGRRGEMRKEPEYIDVHGKPLPW